MRAEWRGRGAGGFRGGKLRARPALPGFWPARLVGGRRTARPTDAAAPSPLAAPALPLAALRPPPPNLQARALGCPNAPAAAPPGSPCRAGWSRRVMSRHPSSRLRFRLFEFLNISQNITCSFRVQTIQH